MTGVDETLWAAGMSHEDTELGDPAPEEAIAAFESGLGLTLPDSHRAYLRRSNGGVVGYARLFGFGRADALDLGRQVSEMRPMIEAKADWPVLPFASTWGGNYFCYDLGPSAGTGVYPVLLWNHEYFEEPEDRPMLWTRFAPDFVAFGRLRMASGLDLPRLLR